jgi:hypothetical protein
MTSVLRPPDSGLASSEFEHTHSRECLCLKNINGWVGIPGECVPGPIDSPGSERAAKMAGLYSETRWRQNSRENTPNGPGQLLRQNGFDCTEYSMYKQLSSPFRTIRGRTAETACPGAPAAPAWNWGFRQAGNRPSRPASAIEPSISGGGRSANISGNFRFWAAS